jgi:hypothetical protein
LRPLSRAFSYHREKTAMSTQQVIAAAAALAAGPLQARETNL